MVLKSSKLDVTSHVTGRLNGQEIELSLEGELVGKIKLPKEGATFELEPNFEKSGNQIIKHYTSTEEPNAQYTDCDQGGWC
ncbi:MAG TPA: YusG family protein [Chondromyces sp.]|nr:YusG family protein [Chondromyces sp.]